MADHPGKGQPQVRPGPSVEVPALEVRIGDDGEHLLEVVDHLQGGHLQSGGDGNHHLHPVGIADPQHQRHQTAHRAARAGLDPLHSQVVEELHLRVDYVGNGQRREGRSVRAAGPGIGRRRTRGSVASAQVVDAHHRVPVGVERPPRSDEAVPPAHLHLLGPPGAHPRHRRVETGGVLAPGQGVEHQDDVVPGLVQFPVHLIGEGRLGYGLPAQGGVGTEAHEPGLGVREAIRRGAEWRVGGTVCHRLSFTHRSGVGTVSFGPVAAVSSGLSLHRSG